MTEDTNSDELSKVYKHNPTIENYLKLRREYPDEVIEIAVTERLDWLFANADLLREIGINPEWFASALDANPVAISKISLHLLEKLVERKHAEGEGKTHLISRGLGVSDSLINYIVVNMLDALSWNDQLEIPRDLIVLLRYQIIGDGETEQSKQFKSHELERKIAMIGAQILERGEQLSTRKIASILKVNASTVSRMFPENQLFEKSQKRLKMFQAFFNSTTPFADTAAKHKP